MNHKEQFSIACKHISPDFKGEIILLNQMEPNGTDTGMLLSCKSCKKAIDKDEESMKDIAKWQTICNHCIFNI